MFCSCRWAQGEATATQSPSPSWVYAYICVTQIAAVAFLVKDFIVEAENLYLCGERLAEGILVSALTSAVSHHLLISSVSLPVPRAVPVRWIAPYQL